LHTESDDSGRIGGLPAHAAFFHARIDHDSHGAFYQSTVYRIAVFSPLLRITKTVFLERATATAHGETNRL
jgi:hypothetical protein